MHNESRGSARLRARLRRLVAGSPAQVVHVGRRLVVRPQFDAAVGKDLKRFFDQYASVSFENYGAGPVA
mgnify:CR=1 FL=1